MTITVAVEPVRVIQEFVMRKILMPFNTFALLKVICMIKKELQILIINGSYCKSKLVGKKEKYLVKLI
jgi:hypothetical protein